MKEKIISLKEAAALLDMSPEVLRRKAYKGLIPGAKPGKYWLFHTDHLEEYLRSHYAGHAKASLGDTVRKKTCHSTNVIITGGSILGTKEKEYKKALGLLIKQPRKGYMTK